MARGIIVDNWESEAEVLAKASVAEGIFGLRDVCKAVTKILYQKYDKSAPTARSVVYFLKNIDIDLFAGKVKISTDNSESEITELESDEDEEDFINKIIQDSADVVHFIPTVCGRLARTVNGKLTGEVKDTVDGNKYTVDLNTIEAKKLSKRFIPLYSRNGRKAKQRFKGWQDVVISETNDMKAHGGDILGIYRCTDKITKKMYELYTDEAPNRADVYEIVRTIITPLCKNGRSK